MTDTITIPRALLEQALQALEMATDNYDDSAVGLEVDAVRALRAELAKPTRCDLCGYQHGHQIGCANNPVDIALSEQAAIAKVEGEDEMKTRFKITFTVAIDYEVNPENYPCCDTDEERLAIDLKNAEDDPFMMLSEDADWKVTGEIVKEGGAA